METIRILRKATLSVARVVPVAQQKHQTILLTLMDVPPANTIDMASAQLKAMAHQAWVAAAVPKDIILVLHLFHQIAYNAHWQKIFIQTLHLANCHVAQLALNKQLKPIVIYQLVHIMMKQAKLI